MRELEEKPECIVSDFSSGFESVIYLYNDTKNYDHPVLYKNFRNYHYSLPSFRENKKNKLLLIPELEVLKDDVKILDLIYSNGTLEGYTMEKSNYQVIDCFDKRVNKIKLLKMIREKIEILNNKNIYIGDFNERNFLSSVERNNIQLCDLDNLKIGNFDFDIKNNLLRSFLNKCDNISAVDSYCFNIFTIAFLGKYDIGYLASNISWEHFLKVLNTPENQEIFRNMIYLNNNYKREFLIDNIKVKEKK